VSDVTTLLFGLPGVRVERVERWADGTRVVHAVTASETAATCPSCGVFSTPVKGQVSSTSPRDIPYGENRIIVRWNKTRWRCREDYCERGSFTESIDQVPARARTTGRLRTQIGAAIGDAARSVAEVATVYGGVVADRAPRVRRPRQGVAGRARTDPGARHRRDPPRKAPLDALRADAAVGEGPSVGHRVRRPGRLPGLARAT
jgi:hypothetical protein